ncbi:MAG: PD-(D/E)XK nuclease family protein, partial [Gemmatimonadota bacterium]|nr:PD-(D/E)XK nuclease family protein [Gemmatimonadota bacterium]
PRPIDVGEWYGRLRRLLESNEIATSSPSHRGVQVLEAHEASLTPFEHAFVIHANEGVFPPRPTGGLLTEAEREALAERGLPIGTRNLAFERERRLWLASVGARDVLISYRTADPSGIPRLASLFVPSHDRSAELARTRRSLPDKRTDPESLVTPAQLLEAEALRFVRVRRSAKRSPFSTPDPDALRAATLRAYAEECRTGGLDEAALRQATEALSEAAVRFDGSSGSLDAAAVFGNQRPLSQRPTPWNGEIRDPLLLSYLRERFSPAHVWSASQLEQYGKRPFDFLLERVLGLREIETAEDEASRLTVGGLVHRILEDFYRGRLGRPSEAFDEEARAALGAAFDDRCARYEKSGSEWVGVPYVWAATRDELRDRLVRFVEWEFTKPASGTPVEVEFVFGRGSERGPLDLSGPGRTDPELPLLLGGRIDRVDRMGDEGAPHRIIDYKSGSGGPSKAAFEDGAALQAPLYMGAVEAAGVGAAATASYRTIRSPADRARRTAADVEPALILAREIARRVRAGLFEAVQARSSDLSPWQPGRDLARTDARIESGTRFDALAPMPLPGGTAGDPPTGDG